MNKWIFRILMSLLILANFLLVYFMFMMLYPFEVVKMNDFKVITPEVERGDYAVIHLSFDKKMEAVPTLTWSLVDGVSYTLGTSGRNRPVGEGTDNIRLNIPSNGAIPPGTYHVQLDASYNIFPFRSPITYSWTSNEFEIK